MVSQVEASVKQMEFIAEIGINHGGVFRRAEDMIIAAKESGADIAKFQMYDPLTILGSGSPYLKDAQQAQFTKGQHKGLKELCDKIGIEYMCSVFHPEDVPFFEDIGMKRYKIASRSTKDIPLITAINATGKPVIASNGLDKELAQLRSLIQPRSKLSVLECIAEYPTTLKAIKDHFQWKLVHDDFCHPGSVNGISSHCPSIVPSLTAIMFGAKIIEHHVRFDWQTEGPDMSSSITFQQFKEMVEITKRELDTDSQFG